MWHKGHFASREKPRDTGITSKDIRLLDSGGSGEALQVHRVVFTSQEAQQQKEETEAMIKGDVPRENLVIFNLQTGTQEASFFQREVLPSFLLVASQGCVWVSHSSYLIVLFCREMIGSHSGAMTTRFASGWSPTTSTCLRASHLTLPRWNRSLWRELKQPPSFR